MSAPPAETRGFLTLASYHAHWLIELADTKASYLMAASAILAGLLGQQAIAACNDFARAVLLLAVALGLASTATALLVLFPRTTPIVASSLLYFPAIRQFPTGAEYLARVQGLMAADTDRELAQQTWELARTQDRKFYWLRRAFGLFGVSLAPMVVGLVWARLGCP